MFISLRKGFTLVEIMIVVAIIAIAMSIAVPSYQAINKSSKRTVCISNLKRISYAVEQYVIENNIATGTGLSLSQEDEIYTGYLRGGLPECPSGGDYIIETVGSNPQVRCTKEDEGHTL